MKKQNKILTAIISIVIMMLQIVPTTYALEAPDVKAGAIVIADMESGNILYEVNMNKDRSPASLTKIMTGLLAVEAIEQGLIGEEDIVVAASDVQTGLDEESSNADPAIMPGEQMKYIDVLYCALLHSANEACNFIAVTVDGSINEFIDHMNLKAKELGAQNTRFFDTNGLKSENTTTAYDLYLITKEAMEHPLFASIVNTEQYTIPATNMNFEERVISNSNALLTTKSMYGGAYRYEGVSGVKTGYTSAAGYCLISTCQKNGMSLMCIILGCDGWLNAKVDDYGNFSGSIKLYDWAFENFEYKTILNQAEQIGSLDVELAKNGDKVGVAPAKSLRLLLPKDVTDDQISKEVTVYDEKLVAPISKGENIGKVTILVNGVNYGSVSLISTNEVEADRSQEIAKKILDILTSKVAIAVGLIIIALIALYFIARWRYRVARKKHMIARAKAEEKRKRERQERKNHVAETRETMESWKASVEKYEQENPKTIFEPTYQKPKETDLDALIRSLGLGEDNIKNKNNQEKYDEQ